MIPKWIKTRELIINSIRYRPQWSVGNFINPRGNAERDFFQASDGRIIKNEGNVIEYKLIVKRVNINN